MQNFKWQLLGGIHFIFYAEIYYGTEIKTWVLNLCFTEHIIKLKCDVWIWFSRKSDKNYRTYNLRAENFSVLNLEILIWSAGFIFSIQFIYSWNNFILKSSNSKCPINRREKRTLAPSNVIIKFKHPFLVILLLVNAQFKENYFYLHLYS